MNTKNYFNKQLWLLILIALPLLPYGPSFGLLVIISIFLMTVSSHRKSIVIVKIWPLMFIFLIGLFSGAVLLLDTGGYYFYFRDVYYFLQPPLLIVMGYYISSFMAFRKVMKLVVALAVISSLISYGDFFLHFTVSSGLSLEQRYEYSLSSHYALIGFMVVWYSRFSRYSLYSKHVALLLLSFFFLLVCLSLSRTNIGLLFVISGIPYVARYINIRIQLAMIFVSVFIAVFMGSLIDVSVADVAATSFIEKLMNSAGEIVVQDHASMFEINHYWRSYEAYLGLSLYLEGNPLQLLVGKGFGAFVSGANVFEDKFQVIPIFHNGFITILLKSGLSGLMLFFIFLYRLNRLYLFDSLGSDEARYLSLLCFGSMWAIVFTTYFTHGIYAPHASVILLFLIGGLMREHTGKTI